MPEASCFGTEPKNQFDISKALEIYVIILEQSADFLIFSAGVNRAHDRIEVLQFYTEFTLKSLILCGNTLESLLFEKFLPGR